MQKQVDKCESFAHTNWEKEKYIAMLVNHVWKLYIISSCTQLNFQTWFRGARKKPKKKYDFFSSSDIYNFEYAKPGYFFRYFL